MKSVNLIVRPISIIIYLCTLIVSCKHHSSSTVSNSDTTAQKVDNSGQTAKRQYSEGMKFLSDRISVQSSDNAKAMELNQKAIEKFAAAYKADTSFTDPVFYASECTMFAKDYISCIYWTVKLKQLDTTQRNQLFCTDRIRYCDKQLKSAR